MLVSRRLVLAGLGSAPVDVAFASAAAGAGAQPLRRDFHLLTPYGVRTFVREFRPDRATGGRLIREAVEFLRGAQS